MITNLHIYVENKRRRKKFHTKRTSVSHGLSKNWRVLRLFKINPQYCRIRELRLHLYLYLLLNKRKEKGTQENALSVSFRRISNLSKFTAVYPSAEDRLKSACLFL